jgi:urease subunit gamma/beta
VHVDPTESERLLIFTAAELARRTLGDGVRLSAPEAVAIVGDEMHRAARRGATYDEVIAAARAAVSPGDLLDGVAELVPELRIEVLLDEGSRLFVLPAPFGVANRSGIALSDEPVVLNEGRPTRRLRVHNTSSRPVRVSSHYPFWKANPRLEFDRERARGYRLDLPAGDSVRWAPDEVREVRLVAYAGSGHVDVDEDVDVDVDVDVDEERGS